MHGYPKYALPFITDSQRPVMDCFTSSHGQDCVAYGYNAVSILSLFYMRHSTVLILSVREPLKMSQTPFFNEYGKLGPMMNGDLQFPPYLSQIGYFARIYSIIIFREAKGGNIDLNLFLELDSRAFASSDKDSTMCN